MQNNGEIVPIKMTSEQIIEMIESLDPKEKQKLLSELQPNMTIIFGGTNLVSHGAALQINAGNDDLSKALDQMPPAALEAFLKALGEYIANQTPQKKD
ncbi:MAG: hypothetical protein AB4057_07940 [Crocosphaera sp.]